uniref:Uncharacterized protein n=1 Tax=Anguilla anguilla TaxID=7936 RepID=A0A0E9WF28_ANGAN
MWPSMTKLVNKVFIVSTVCLVDHLVQMFNSKGVHQQGVTIYLEEVSNTSAASSHQNLSTCKNEIHSAFPVAI